jgi:hypothetical protein
MQESSKRIILGSHNSFSFKNSKEYFKPIYTTKHLNLHLIYLSLLVYWISNNLSFSCYLIKHEEELIIEFFEVDFDIVKYRNTYEINQSTKISGEISKRLRSLVREAVFNFKYYQSHK